MYIYYINLYYILLVYATQTVSWVREKVPGISSLNEKIKEINCSEVSQTANHLLWGGTTVLAPLP